MTHDDAGVDQLVCEIARGAKVDWESTESGVADESTRKLIRELAVIAAIADVHSSLPLPDESHAPHAPAGSVPDMPATWGTFALLEKVGEGAFGEVYRAWDTRLDREVALKLLPANLDEPAHATSIIQEGRLLARVHHTNVVTIYGAERIENRIGLWMELVKGRTLEQILEERTVLGEAESVGIAAELCRAVAAVHGAGLLHRDIKAQNVMRSDDGRIVLMDFGAGRKLEDDASTDLAGTPLYLAPEVLQGQQATVRSDLYSLGVLLYHLVTGAYPVRGRTVGELRTAHARGERTPVRVARRDVSVRLARVIERAIDPRPELRYQGAAALSADLAALRPRPTIVRLAWATAAAVACIVIVAAGWEILGRRVGASIGPGLLLAGFVDSHVSVRPVERPVIAVLPFKNLSAEPESDYVADGLTDEVIRNLSTVQGLQVVSSTSAFVFKGHPRNLQAIADRLGANLVVEGSAVRDGSRLRINAKMSRVADDVPLWTEQFDRPVGDNFSIHAEIARAIVTRLQLTPANHARHYGANLEAYDLFLKGRALIDRRGVSSAGRAAEFFEHAIARDPKFALAHAGLANAYAFLSFPHRGIHSFATAFPIMKRAAETAIQLDPTLAEAHMAMGWVYAYQHDWANAERSFQQAIALNPGLTQAYTSYSLSTLQPLRKFDEALRLLRVAAVRDPLSLDVQREVGEAHLFAGRYQEAITAFQGVRDVDPDYPFVHTLLAQALIFSGRLDEAILLFQPSAIWPISIYVRRGQRAEAEKLAAEHHDHAFRRAVIAAAMGDTLASVDAIEEVAAADPQRVGRLLNEPEVARVRNHPRIVAVRKALDLP